MPLRSAASPLILGLEVLGGDGGAAGRVVPDLLGVDEALQQRGLAQGVDAMMAQPRRAACWRVVSMRGWLVPGFWPMTKIASARSKSSRLTVPLPTPSVSPRPKPLDSWHMLEQSGRLLVPSCRARSW
jgi:hypothetical protein